MITIGVSNENLSELVARHKSYNLFHPLSIEFVEDIIEQQQGSRLRVGAL
jgi:hypothetical protein